MFSMHLLLESMDNNVRIEPKYGPNHLVFFTIPEIPETHVAHSCMAKGGTRV
jgi:hypothetical protein